jgi:hypothetical protein
MKLFDVVVGLAAVVLAAMQCLAALGKLELNSYPFVQTPSRALRLAGAAVWLFIGLTLLATAVWT